MEADKTLSEVFLKAIKLVLKINALNNGTRGFFKVHFKSEEHRRSSLGTEKRTV